MIKDLPEAKNKLLRHEGEYVTAQLLLKEVCHGGGRRKIWAQVILTNATLAECACEAFPREAVEVAQFVDDLVGGERHRRRDGTDAWV